LGETGAARHYFFGSSGFRVLLMQASITYGEEEKWMSRVLAVTGNFLATAGLFTNCKSHFSPFP